MRYHKLIIPIALGAFLLAPAPARSQEIRHVDVTVHEGTNMALALSPDGRTLALDLLGRIWTLPVAGGEAQPITDEFGDTRQPTWSPDGSRIAFQSYRDGTWHVWSVTADGSELVQHTFGPYDDREPHWSHDGSSIVFSSDRSGNYDIWQLAVENGELQQLTANEANDYAPAFSPDDASIAFISERGGTRGVWSLERGSEPRPLAAVPGRLAGPAWSPDGEKLVLNSIQARESKLLVIEATAGSAREQNELAHVSQPGEDVFPFRAAWISATELFYTADGRIKRGSTSGEVGEEVEFEGTVTLTRHNYDRKKRDFDGSGPEPVRGILGPAVSPAGDRIAFTALGDLWILPIGGEPQRLTDDPYTDFGATWSPDGSELAFVSDREGMLELWVRDMESGVERKLTQGVTGVSVPSWSPDGSRIVFRTEQGLSTGLQMLDLTTGEVESLRSDLFFPGRVTWSPDGSTIAMAVLHKYSTRYREGQNEILLMSLEGEPDRTFTPVPHRSVGGRAMDGPVWSPDGHNMAYVSDGFLWVIPVGTDGEPLGPPRRLSNELADGVSWTGDSETIVYQTNDGLRRVFLSDGRVEKIPVELTWTRKQPTGRLVVHAGALFDGKTDRLQHNVDIVIEGNRIVEVVPHRSDLHDGEVIDASNQTVMPGLIESHSHQGFGFGESLGRIWLSYGITMLRDPASDPFKIRERREAVEAGVRIGPRELATGRMFDGDRIYYSFATPMTSGAQLDLALERADQLDYDFIKTYVRASDLMQRRVIEFAHSVGIPVASHELYPAVAYGGDHVEHISGTSRRGYSPKVSYLNHSYQDVIALLGASGMTLCPTIGIMGGFWYSVARDTTLLADPRVQTLFDPSYVQMMTDRGRRSGGNLDVLAARLEPLGSTVRRVVDAGGLVIAGTDSPITPYGLSLHTELENYVDGGLSPFEALQTATVVPAAALGLADELGSVGPGMLADFVIVEGNPLEDIKNARRVVIVVKNGEVYTLDELLRRPKGT